MNDVDPVCVACISRRARPAATDAASPDESQGRDVSDLAAGDGSVEFVTPSVRAHSDGLFSRRHARDRLSGGYLEGGCRVPTSRGGRNSFVLGSSDHSVESAAFLLRRRRRSVGGGPNPSKSHMPERTRKHPLARKHMSYVLWALCLADIAAQVCTVAAPLNCQAKSYLTLSASPAGRFQYT